MCKACRLHALQRPGDFLTICSIEQGQTPTMAANATGNKVPARKAKLIQRSTHLWHVADGGVAASHRFAQHTDRAAAWCQQAEDRAHQGGLARSVGSEHADELIVANRNIDAGEYPSGAKCQRCPNKFNGTHCGVPESAWPIASSSLIIQSW